MKLKKNRVISIIICLLLIGQIFPSGLFSVPAFANSPEPKGSNDTSGDITLPIDPFHTLSYVSAKAATCTDNGNKAYYVCSDCGKWFEDSLGTVEITDKSSVVIPATGHTPVPAVTENEVAASCEVDGSYDEVVYCSVCHAEISRETTTVPAIGHEWDEGTVTTSATCTTDGVRTYTCKHDASHTYTEAISATGHTPASAVTENEVAATCEVDGSYDEVVYCSVCHAEISRETTTVPAIGHEWDEGTVTTSATCTTEGVRTYTCKHDASHTYTEATPATGHTPAEAVRENEVAATCSAAGSYDEVVYCSVCHEEISRVKKTTPIDEDAHDWGEWVQTKAPTETEPGEETRTCKNDPSHTETREIPALGHTHNLTLVPAKNATCTEAGNKAYYTCSGCGKWFEDASGTVEITDKSSVVIAAAGHTPGASVQENVLNATCETDGSYDEVVYCSTCHAELSRETTTVPALGHDWGEWVQTKAPTETEPGEETHTCKNDPSHKETREIAPLGPSQVELSFLDDEVIIVVPNGSIPDESEFDVQKIVPPPAEVVEKVKDQMGASSEVLAYYEVRLTAADGSSIIHLDGEITIKVKMPEQYVGSNCVRILQEDETGKLIVMESWWKNDYLCYKTDWLEIYN